MIINNVIIDLMMIKMMMKVIKDEYTIADYEDKISKLKLNKIKKDLFKNKIK